MQRKPLQVQLVLIDPDTVQKLEGAVAFTAFGILCLIFAATMLAVPAIIFLLLFM